MGRTTENVMKHEFFQRLLPINKLIKVGEIAVPDFAREWRITVPSELRVHFSMEHTPPDFVREREHTYKRVRTITGDIFVANVEVTTPPINT